MRLLHWLWKNTVVSNFMAGLFGLLPLILTVAICVYVGDFFVGSLGPDSIVGGWLKLFGTNFVNNQWIAYGIGCAVALGAIWCVGILLKSEAKGILEGLIERVFGFPVVKSVYKTTQQVVQMIRKDNPDVAGMKVVFVRFGKDPTNQEVFSGNGVSYSPIPTFPCGVLALKVCGKTFEFNGVPYEAVYLPTSPVPMSGGILFVHPENIQEVSLGPEAMMQIYLSLGVVSEQLIPKKYHYGSGIEAAEDDEDFLAELQKLGD